MIKDPEQIITELRRALGQSLGVLSEVCNHLTLQSEAHAALHRASDHVTYPPLHRAVLQAVSDAHNALHWSGHLAGDPASPPPVDLPRVTKLTPPPPTIHADERRS